MQKGTRSRHQAIVIVLDYRGKVRGRKTRWCLGVVGCIHFGATLFVFGQRAKEVRRRGLLSDLSLSEFAARWVRIFNDVGTIFAGAFMVGVVVGK